MNTTSGDKGIDDIYNEASSWVVIAPQICQPAPQIFHMSLLMHLGGLLVFSLSRGQPWT